MLLSLLLACCDSSRCPSGYRLVGSDCHEQTVTVTSCVVQGSTGNCIQEMSVPVQVRACARYACVGPRP